MSRVFFEESGLPEPDFDLGVSSGSLAEHAARTMLGSDQMLAETKPDICCCPKETPLFLDGLTAAGRRNLPIVSGE